LEILVGVLHELEQDRVNHTNEFVVLKNIPIQTSNNAQQPPPSIPPSPNTNVGFNKMVCNEDDFLSCVKQPLSARILAKIIPKKKSDKFTKFGGM